MMTFEFEINSLTYEQFNLLLIIGNEDASESITVKANLNP
jgi:hypothetical protein